MEDRDLFLLLNMQSRVKTSLRVRESLDAGERVELPVVRPPALVPIKVRVPPPAPLKEEMVEEALIKLLKSQAETAERIRGPAIAGDVVLVDVIAYEDGKVVPFTAHRDIEIELTEDYELTELAEALVGVAPGETRSAVVDVPRDHANPRIAGHRLVFAAQAKRIRERRVPAPEDPVFLERVGVETLEQLMEAVVEGLVQSQQETWVEEARRRVQRAYLARTARFEVPLNYLNGRIRDLWTDHERPALEAWGLSNEELMAAVLAWVDDKRYANEIRETLAIELMLDAVADTLEPYPSDQQLVALGPAMARALGMSESVLAEVKAFPPGILHFMCRTLRHRGTTDHLMQLAELEVGEDDLRSELEAAAAAPSPEEQERSEKAAPRRASRPAFTFGAPSPSGDDPDQG